MKRTLRILACALALALVAPVSATAAPAVSLRLLARWRVSQPITIANAGDGSDRLFVLEKTGKIRVIKGGQLLSTPMLDLSSKVSRGTEQGLLGIAFPPGFAAKQYFYVNYTDTLGDTVIARYYMTANPDVATTAGAQTILRVDQPYSNHNGGGIVFGPDGYLYIGMGDGGSAGDPLGNAQKHGVLLGKMLRINTEGASSPYGIPPSNPFVGVAGYRSEIWALGLRNPWRFSFDSATGELYMGDVGQTAWEEVNIEPAGFAGGRNYGWNYYEGNHAYPPGSTPKSTSGLTFPQYEYNHSTGGHSVTGGYVYRGANVPSWNGLYFFADFEWGKIWAMDTATHTATLGIDSTMLIPTFGESESGELYVSEYLDSTIYELKDGSVPAEVSLKRLQGADRYATAIAIAHEAFPSSATTAVIATGERFPDALSASALAGAVSGPLLLTPSTRLEQRLLDTLAGIGVTDVYIVGGPSAVSTGVENGLAGAGYAVTRIAGIDRYGTAANVARKVKQIEGPAFSGNVFVARGDLFPDALAAAPLAYAGHGPVLLTRTTVLPSSTSAAIAQIGATGATVLGSTAAVSNSVASALGVPVTRWSGSDRYATAAEVAAGALGRGWTTYSHIGIATGLLYPDGLTGAVEAGSKGGVLLLTRSDSLPYATRLQLLMHQTDATSAAVYGGTPSVSSGTYQLVRWHLP
jgi:putative cell wall-binding protein/glucose/arabinose dehydrogenase